MEKKSIAVKAIELELRNYILTLQKEDDYVGQEYENLYRTIMDWSREDNNLVKKAMEKTVRMKNS